MENERYIWVFDRALLEHFRLPDFTLLEGVLIILGLASLAAYLFLIVVLDRRARRKAREARQLDWVERWLENAQLTAGQMETLEWLAGDSGLRALHNLLGDPVRFERRIHEEVAAGHAAALLFTLTVRDKLRYGSDNLRVPLVSTRQLVPGDAIRLSLWSAGLPVHFYGRVIRNGMRDFTIEIRNQAVKSALADGGNADLFLLRGHGLEYWFSCGMAGQGSEPDQLMLTHSLAKNATTPRSARLPLISEITFRERSITRNVADELDPDMPASTPQKGLLLDLSEGGFSMAHDSRIQTGHYVEFTLPLRKGRRKPMLVGRVLECRAFSGNQWLSRCELRGLRTSIRNLLHQVVRLEQHNRMKARAHVKRRSPPPPQSKLAG